MVERVVRAVEVSTLPAAPHGVRGVINLQGRIVPVFDLAWRIGQPAREVRASDHLIVVHTHWRTVALLVDSVSGVVAQRDTQVTPVSEILTDLQSVSGMMKLDGGIVFIQDIERFLSVEDHAALELALSPEP